MEQSKPQKALSGRKRVLRWIKRLLIGFSLFVLLLATMIAFVVWYFGRDLPSFESLDDYHPAQVTRFVDRKGRVMAELFDQKRTVVAMERIPKHVRNAFLAAEDADFYHHPGMDVSGLVRAFWHNLKAGRVVEGGSTITQQVIKTFLTGPEKSYVRKIRELLLALRLESHLTKDEIFSLYLNQIFFGHQCYGIQEASRFYFGKDVSEISLAEGALLASLPKSPARYSPIRHVSRALERKNWVLSQMAIQKFISEAEAQGAQKENLRILGEAADFYSLAPYYVEHCRRMLEASLGRDLLYRGGLRIELAADLEMNQSAQKALEEGLREIDRRQGFRGPLGRLTFQEIELLHQKHPIPEAQDLVWSLEAGDTTEGTGRKNDWRVSWVKPVVGKRLLVPVSKIAGEGKAAIAKLDLGGTVAQLGVQQVQWARKFSPVSWTPPPSSVAGLLSEGDLIEVQIETWKTGQVSLKLSQPPLVQGAIVAIEPNSHHVLALIGGSDFKRSPLIRAVQSKRQPGSAFKPVVYTAALHSGNYTPTTMLIDSPEVYYSGIRGSTWKPENFERVFMGPVSLRQALAHSINTVAVKITSDIGPEKVSAMAHTLGIHSELGNNPSLALGTYEVTPLELTNAYATFAALGLVDDPIFVTAIVQPNGTQLEPAPTQPQQAISAAEAFLMTSLLKDVIEEGTGKKAQVLGRPMAGKTGTASEHRDAWFVGYAPKLVAGVWVGFDDHTPLGASWAQGAGTALPIWIAFMEQALRNTPKDQFAAPPGVVFVRLNPSSGLLAQPGDTGAVWESFIEGTEPREMSNHLDSPGSGEKEEGRTQSNPPATGRLPEGLFH